MLLLEAFTQGCHLPSLIATLPRASFALFLFGCVPLFYSLLCRFLLRGKSPLHPYRPQLRHLKESPETFALLVEVVYWLRFGATFTL